MSYTQIFVQVPEDASYDFWVNPPGLDVTARTSDGPTTLHFQSKVALASFVRALETSPAVMEYLKGEATPEQEGDA